MDNDKAKVKKQTMDEFRSGYRGVLHILSIHLFCKINIISKYFKTQIQIQLAKHFAW